MLIVCMSFGCQKVNLSIKEVALLRHGSECFYENEYFSEYLMKKTDEERKSII